MKPVSKAYRRSRYIVDPGQRVHVRDWDPGDTGGFEEGSATERRVKHDLDSLLELQALLYAAQCHAVLIVLQGIDTAGKDGTIRHVFSGVNPEGCDVVSFKVPTAVELSHDYLWRYHLACPGKGTMMIFNRSHYEAVLVERVHDIVPKKVWSRRYDEINRFEELLAGEGTIILKFLLHISRAEQKRRLLARMENPEKRWKANPRDWEERRKWDDYEEAIDDMLSRTSTSHAPWTVVPADHKWFRNLVVADVIAARLEKHQKDWRKAMLARGRAAVAGKDGN